jgi:very-short-patch-repair endonuclease
MQRKRALRREATVEDLLWLRLKALEGWRFRRKSSFQTFALQFVEHDALLVVELEANRAQRSPVRDRLLHQAGYTILLQVIELSRDLTELPSGSVGNRGTLFRIAL